MTGQLFIDNQWQTGQGEPFQSVSPATKTQVWHGNAADSNDVKTALLAARAAFSAWSEMDLEQRIQVARKFATIVQENANEFANMISLEMGKPLWESRTEVAAVAGKVQLAVDSLKSRRDTVTSEMGGYRAVTRYKPHGVLGILGPFNLPAHLPNGHLIPAILAGNTIVLKPSELTPRVGEMMVGYWELAGIPAGVINLVQGGRETGIALATDCEIDGVLFTGSSRAGIALNQALAATPNKMIALEMGGNNPLVVHQSQNLEAAAYHTVLSAYITSGQRCTCARRLYLVKGTQASEFMDCLVEMIGRIRVGFPEDQPEPFIGPVVNQETGRRMLVAQEKMLAAGGRILCRMEEQQGCAALLSPGLIDVTDVASLDDEEWFGPLLQVVSVDSFDDAIVHCNQTKYGLAAGLISDNPELYAEFIRKIRAGVVNWNRQTTGASGKLPFGGCGLSGNHRPGGYFAADYCSFPMASLESEQAVLPENLATGIDL
jgi:succinylglutamic semialdehyde dehydrogenase